MKLWNGWVIISHHFTWKYLHICAIDSTLFRLIIFSKKEDIPTLHYKWAPCWPNEPCYLGRCSIYFRKQIPIITSTAIFPEKKTIKPIWYEHVLLWFCVAVAIALRKISVSFPESKVDGANMGPIWGRQDLGGPHVSPMNFVIWVNPLTYDATLNSFMYYLGAVAILIWRSVISELFNLLICPWSDWDRLKI